MKNTVWRNVKHVATRKEYWFQQDGASCYVTAQCLSTLRSNHLSQHATLLATIFARPFTTGLFFLEPMYAICEKGETQEHVGSPLARQQNIDEEVLRKMVRHNRKRAVHCIDSLGSHFQQLLQIYVKINKWYAFASILLFTDLKNSDYKYI